MPVPAPGLEITLPVWDSHYETGDVQELPAMDMGRDLLQPVQGIEGEGGEIAMGQVSRMSRLHFRKPSCACPYHHTIPEVMP